MRNERRWLRLGALIAILATTLVGVFAIGILRNRLYQDLKDRQIESTKKQIGSSLEEFRQILEQESSRPFTEYSHSNFRGVSAESFIQFSNISSLQPSVRIPGLVGFFQIVEKKKLELPFFPEGLQTDRQDRERRRDLARKVLATIFKTQPLSTKNDARLRFSQIFRGVWLPNINTSDIVPIKAIPTKAIATKTFSKSAPSKREDIHSISQSLTLASHALPIQAFLLENGFLVFYRSVILSGKNLTQGFVVDQKSFFRSLFEDLANDASKNLTLVVDDRELDIFNSPQTDALQLLQVEELSPIQNLSLVVSSQQAKLDTIQLMMLTLVALVFCVIIGVVLLMYRIAIRQLELSERQAAFVSSVSHELRTPITAIRMHGELLKSGWSKDETTKSTSYDYILKESERLSRLIENVLRYARIGRDSDALNIETIEIEDLRSLIRENIKPLVLQGDFAFELVDSKSDANKSKNESNNESVNDFEINVDRDALVQILINLVENGMKFSRSSQLKKIVLGIEQSSDCLEIRIRDFGPGISTTNQHRIFELFFRGEDEMTRTTPGTGLGLALVKSLSDRMGIEVRFENRSPGCEFFLKIPRTQATDLK